MQVLWGSVLLLYRKRKNPYMLRPAISKNVAKKLLPQYRV